MSVHKKQKTVNETTYSKTRFVEYKGSHIWKINGFLTKCPLENSKWLQSSKFNVPGCESKFFMRLYPKGDINSATVVSLYIFAVPQQRSINCEFALIDISGRAVNKQKIQNRIIDTKGMGFANFISQKDLQKQQPVLLPDDQLIVSCILTIYGEAKVSYKCSVPSTDGNTCVDDLASLFDGKEGADVLLKVGNEYIPAHKSILICRSSVFSAMFKSDMREGNTGEVQVSDIDRDVFVALLTFLYTDRLSVTDVAFAIKLLVAADKYAVQLLQSKCAQYLAENLSTANVFDILLVADACRSKELSQKCVRLIKREKSVTDVVDQLDDSPHLIAVMKENLKRKLNRD